MFETVIYSCDQSWIFSIITNQRVTWSFRNHSNMLIWCSRNIYYYCYQCWKQYFCGNHIYFQYSLII